MIRKILLLVLGSLCGFCTTQTNQEITSAAYYRVDQSIVLPEDSPWLPYISVSKATAAEHRFEHYAMSVIRTIPTQYVEIQTPFSGRLIKSNVVLGQHVSRGTPLFELNSPEYVETQKEFLNAKQEYLLTKNHLALQQDLLNHQVGVRQDFELAQGQFQIAKNIYKSAKEALKIYQDSFDLPALGSALVVRAPIDGEILEINMTPGQYLGSESEGFITMANLEKVWVVSYIKEKDMHHLSNNDSMEVRTSLGSSEFVSGKLIHVNEILDQDSRSIEVYVEIENPKRSFKPGLFTEVRFLDKPVSVIQIPEKAILQSEDSEFVFIAVGTNSYEKRDITSLGVHNGNALVVQGLTSEDQVVNQGAIYLLKAL